MLVPRLDQKSLRAPSPTSNPSAGHAAGAAGLRQRRNANRGLFGDSAGKTLAPPPHHLKMEAADGHGRDIFFPPPLARPCGESVMTEPSADPTPEPAHPAGPPRRSEPAEVTRLRGEGIRVGLEVP